MCKGGIPMKLIKVLVIFLGILLLCVGCSQDLLNRLLQQDSEAEIDHETLGILLAHICYDSVDQVFEQTVDAEGFSWETNANNQPFTINRTIENGNIQETGSGAYSFNPTSKTLTASITNFKITFLGDIAIKDENDKPIGSVKKGGAITVSNYTLQAQFAPNPYEQGKFFPSNIIISSYPISGSFNIDFIDSAYKDGTLKFENFKLNNVTITLSDPKSVPQVTVNGWDGKITFEGEEVTKSVVDEFKWILPEVIERESEN